MNEILLIYATTPTEKIATDIAEKLLQSNLIACANIFPSIKSIYKWEGKINNDTEIVVILKTRKNKFITIKEEIEKIHPYQVPCIAAIDAETNSKFFEFVMSCVK